MSNDDQPASDKSNMFWHDEDDPASPPSSPDTILSIGNVAKMFGVSRLTLRFYEARGLIERRHRVGRSRVYGWADCDRIAFIMKARRAGLKLSEIAPLIEMADNVLSDRVLGRQLCMALIDRLERRRRALEEALSELRHMHMLLCAKPFDSDEDDAPERD